MQIETNSTDPAASDLIAVARGSGRDSTLIALWGILNLCSFFFVLEGAAILLLLALATENKKRIAWLGLPALVGWRLVTGNLWWSGTGARESFPILQIVWVTLAAAVTIQSIYFFFSAPSELKLVRS